MIKELEKLAAEYFGSPHLKMSLLQGDGSDRRIYRILSEDDQRSAIAVWHDDLQENSDFLFITKQMKELGIPTPGVLGELNPIEGYLIEDLGDDTLAAKVEEWNEQNHPNKVMDAYRRVLDYLPSIQEQLAQLSYNHLKGRVMDQKLVTEDINYFIENFVERFDYKQQLSSSLVYEIQQRLIEPIVALDASYFVYRDFQSRNIMWKNGGPWFIDYQGALLGNRYYDLASLLYASKSGLDEEQREELIRHAHGLIGQDVSYEEFFYRVYLFVLLRRLRSFGTYGFLSVVKGKRKFFASIRPSLDELLKILLEKECFKGITELPKAILHIRNSWVSREKQYQHLLSSEEEAS